MGFALFTMLAMILGFAMIYSWVGYFQRIKETKELVKKLERVYQQAEADMYRKHKLLAVVHALMETV